MIRMVDMTFPLLNDLTSRSRKGTARRAETATNQSTRQRTAARQRPDTRTSASTQKSAAQSALARTVAARAQ